MAWPYSSILPRCYQRGSWMVNQRTVWILGEKKKRIQTSVEEIGQEREISRVYIYGSVYVLLLYFYAYLELLLVMYSKNEKTQATLVKWASRVVSRLRRLESRFGGCENFRWYRYDLGRQRKKYKESVRIAITKVHMWNKVRHQRVHPKTGIYRPQNERFFLRQQNDILENRVRYLLRKHREHSRYTSA